MVIALVIGVVIGFLTALISGLTLLGFLRLRSTVDRDRTAVHEAVQRLSLRLSTLEGAEAGPASAPRDAGKVLPFRKKPRKEALPAPEPIEDPPSGESECVKTLADLIRLMGDTLPADRDAAVQLVASMFREDPKADMDTDSGPLWIDTINHFLRENPYATVPEVGAEYNRRAEEHNRRLDEEESPLDGDT